MPPLKLHFQCPRPATWAWTLGKLKLNLRQGQVQLGLEYLLVGTGIQHKCTCHIFNVKNGPRMAAPCKPHLSQGGPVIQRPASRPPAAAPDKPPPPISHLPLQGLEECGEPLPGPEAEGGLSHGIVQSGKLFTGNTIKCWGPPAVFSWARQGCKGHARGISGAVKACAPAVAK